jgi:hypothetical protein
MAAQEELDLRAALATCGLTVPQCDVLVNNEGFTSLASVGVLGGDTDVTEMAKRLASRTVVDGRTILGTVQIKNLQALVFWVKDRQKRGLNLDVNDWTPAEITTIMTTKEVRKEEKDNYSKPSITDLGTFDPQDFEVFEEGFINYLARLRGAQGEDLRYVIRPEQAPDEFETEQQRRMFQIPLNGVAYDQDNATVYRDLKAFNNGTSGETWITDFEATEDGRGAWLAWTNHYNGQGELSKRTQLAKTRLGNLHYKNERSMSFEHYTSQMQKYFQTLDKDPDEKYSERRKVEKLIASFKPDSSDLSSAGVIAMQQYPRDFTAACNYLSAEVSRVFGQAIIENQRFRQRKRNVSALGGDRGGGRGRGRFERGRGGRGRGYGRGHGRGGRGRGGRGGRGRGSGSGRGSRNSINGVDVSNVRRSFTSNEWNQLGQEGRDYINMKRNELGGSNNNNNNDRNVSGVGTQVEAQEADQQGDGAAGAPGNGERGGQNGLVFGRGAYAGRGSSGRRTGGRF